MNRLKKITALLLMLVLTAALFAVPATAEEKLVTQEFPDLMLTLQLIGDGLRDALDPKLRK